MIRNILKLTLATLVLALLITPSAPACVGKTLVIGSKGTLQQDILAEILSTLISERTGTTVKIVRFDSTAATHEALMKADLDMYVEYTGVAQGEILKQPVADSQALYESVKSAYNRDLNLVWLKPLGFSEPSSVVDNALSEAAPVVRKDTLKKFPALARLIDKLGGAISQEAMVELEKRAAGGNLREVVREFLKGARLI